MQILGYLQLVLAFTALFFWCMIEYPLVCRAMWKQLRDEHSTSLKEDGEDMSKYGKLDLEVQN